jgi:hypothetical protein
MIKHRTQVKLSKAQKLENEVSRWTAKKEAAIAMLIKSSAMLKQLDRTQRRLRKANQAELARVTEEHHAKTMTIPLSELHETDIGKANAESWNEIPAVRKAAPKPEAKADDGIPAFLRRTQELQAMANPRTKEKKAERRAVEREKREAELTGKRRKLPPTGKAAFEAIRTGK